MLASITTHTRSALFALGLAAAAGCSSSAAPAPGNEMPVTRTLDGNLQWGACPPIFPAGCEIAVLHGDPAKPNADVFLRVPAGYAIPAHRHSSAERMILVQGQLRVHYDGAAAEVLTTGEYAYGPAGLPHTATCMAGSPCTLFIACEGPVDAEATAEPAG